MKNKIIFSLMMLIGISAICQDKGKFSFEIGFGNQQISMSDLNHFYLDNFAIPRKDFETKINTAKKIFTGVRYQPSNFFDFGFYCHGQKAELNGSPSFYSTDEYGAAILLNQGTSNLFINSFGYGITTNMHINYFLKLHKKPSKFLNKIKILGELNIGESLSFARISILYPILFEASIFQTQNIKSFESQFSLKFQYDYIPSPIISGIGIKVGYQYLKTKTLKDQLGKDWIVEGKNKINLDFGGYFAGLYFTIGK